MSDESLADILVRGRGAPESLNEVEQERARAYLGEMIWINFHIWSRIQEGVMEPRFWDNGEQYLARMYVQHAVGKQVWQGMKGALHPEYVSAVEAK